MMRDGRVLIRSRPLWLAWYPLRGRRCSLSVTDKTRNGRWHLSAGLGPLYLGVGPGVPFP